MNLSDLKETFAREGGVILPGFFSGAELAAVNRHLDPIFNGVNKCHEPRSVK